ncbi:putative phospholipid ABC transporter permease protein MlaE [bacterium HR19]|nr:putative phospholipid ABC transporter permease protein MlaE [bacterium HR19]
MNFLGVVRDIVGILIFSFQLLREIFRPPYRISLILREIEFAGVKSLPIIALTSVFLGMVFTLHSIRALSLARMETLVGQSVMLSFARELASGFGGLIITGRVGSAYCSKIGTMKVTEQIDALYLMGISPVHYVAVPKVIALMISMPLIYFFFIILGMIGGIISAQAYGIDPSMFLKDVHSWVGISDILLGITKSMSFGLAIGITSCYFGFSARGSSEAVGERTTESIVFATVMIFILNYIISRIYYLIR